jgi:uncharacterized membrane protein YczE
MSGARGRRPLWVPGLPGLAQLLVGLTAAGAGQAMMDAATLGASPWLVLAQGVAAHTSLGTGAATIAISVAVLLLWIPLRVRPGLGTLASACVIGLVLAVALALLQRPDALIARAALLLAGIGLVALGSGLYIATDLGAGPRDGLMTGLHVRTGRSIRVVRVATDVSVLTLGWLLGGTVGAGTVLFAVSMGPAVHATLAGLGWAPTSAHGRLRPALEPCDEGAQR